MINHHFNYLDLFSGIGGFALGAYWAGMKFDNHYFSEIDPYCINLYKKRFPDAIHLGDIKELNCEKLADATSSNAWSWEEQQKGKKPIKWKSPYFLPNSCGGGGKTETGNHNWIITGGFPCQDISVAGKGAGITGARSGLWFEYWRIIRDLRPRFAIMENVGALTFRGLTDVLGSLAEIGYDAEWQDIRAEDMGAPHRRERIWIVAYPQRVHDDSGGHGAGKICRQRPEQTDVSGSEKIPDTTRELFNRARKSGPTGRSKSANSSWWESEPDVGRLANGVPHRVDRLRGLGNAIIPQIAEVLFNLIKKDYYE